MNEYFWVTGTDAHLLYAGLIAEGSFGEVHKVGFPFVYRSFAKKIDLRHKAGPGINPFARITENSSLQGKLFVHLAH